MMRRRVAKTVPLAVVACAVMAAFGMWRWHQSLAVAAVGFGVVVTVFLGAAAVALAAPNSAVGRRVGEWLTADDDDD